MKDEWPTNMYTDSLDYSVNEDRKVPSTSAILESKYMPHDSNEGTNSGASIYYCPIKLLKVWNSSMIKTNESIVQYSQTA